ncbi:MAG: hypothetical protein M3Y65_14150 [Pseudomonadota bacterium]|nr:hypothetical protein [Pseudomonadota bacterium]
MLLLPRPPDRPAATRGRHAWLAWLLAIALVVQLFGLTQHDHPHSAKSQHCTACTLHAQPHAAPPLVKFAAAPVKWVLLTIVLQAFTAAPAGPAVAYLLPPPHAPPAFLLPH